MGLGVLSGRARVFGWVAAGWLLAIALNLLTTGRFLDVAARDVALAGLRLRARAARPGARAAARGARAARSRRRTRARGGHA